MDLNNDLSYSFVILSSFIQKVILAQIVEIPLWTDFHNYASIIKHSFFKSNLKCPRQRPFGIDRSAGLWGFFFFEIIPGFYVYPGSISAAGSLLLPGTAVA